MLIKVLYKFRIVVFKSHEMHYPDFFYIEKPLYAVFTENKTCHVRDLVTYGGNLI